MSRHATHTGTGLALALATLVAAATPASGQDRPAVVATPQPGWSIHVDPGAPTSGTPPAAAAARDEVQVTEIAQVRQAWDLGTLVAGRTYVGKVTLENTCTLPVRVGIFNYGLRDLLIPPVATLPAGRPVDVPFRVTPRSPADGAGVARGLVVFWMASGSDEACKPVRVAFDATAAIRTATAGDEAREQALRARDVRRDACVAGWMAGTPLASDTEVDCTAIVREILKDVRGYLERDPLTPSTMFAGVPSAAAIDTMPMPELRGLRATFETVLAANDLPATSEGEEWMAAKHSNVRWFVSDGTNGGANVAPPPTDWFSVARAKDYFSTFHVAQGGTGPATVNVRFVSPPTITVSVLATPGVASLDPWAGRLATDVPRVGHFTVIFDKPIGDELGPSSTTAVPVDPGAANPTTSSWALGRLTAGHSYGGSITLTNLCSVERQVSIFATGQPDFLIPRETTISANGQVELPYLFDVPSDAAGNLTGQLAVWAPSVDPSCQAFQEAFNVSGRIEAAAPAETGRADGWQVRQSAGSRRGFRGSTDGSSQVDRLDRYDFDEDGNFDEPDGYVDDLDPVDANEAERGYSYQYYFRHSVGPLNAEIENLRRRLPDAFRNMSGHQNAAVEPPAGGAKASLDVGTPSTPVDLREDQPDALQRYFVARYGAGRVRPLDLDSIAFNSAAVAAAPVHPDSQYVVADQATVAYVDNAVVMVSRGVFRRRLAGWLRPSPPRFAIASPAPLPLPVNDGPQKSITAAPSVAAVDDLLIYVTSTGPLGAGAFRAVLVNGTGVPITIGKSVTVLEPVARLTAKDVERELKAASHLPQKTVTLDGYCLERTKAAPKAGMVFRIARPEARARYGPVARVLASARQLRDQKALTPDVAPDDYQHSIVQWAIWAQQERFDEQAFTAAFAAYTKKNVVAAGAKWTRQMDAAVAEIAPNRWRDVSRIVHAAGAPVGATTGQ